MSESYALGAAPSYGSGPSVKRGGLFDLPEEGSKRSRKSRVTVVGGQTVLRENLYDMDVGASVFDDYRSGDVADEDETFHLEIGESGGHYLRDPVTKRLHFITSSGKVYDVAAERHRMRNPKPVQVVKQKAPRVVDTAHTRHVNKLRDDRDSSERVRQQYVAKHIDLFRPFLDNKQLNKLKTVQVPHGEIGSERLRQLAIGQQPKCIAKTTIMRDYQLLGVNFLLRMYANGMSCILADEMGLGKTLQTIAFLGHLKDELNVHGPHLVVVPLSVLSNWCQEFARHCPRLVVRRFHVSDMTEKNARRADIMAGASRGTIDVVVTTYEMLVSEKSSGIANMRFRYVILDEAHKVKSDATLVSNACKRITRELTIMLTGTPLQNNLRECWCLLNNMQPDIFSKGELFDDAFDAADMARTDLKLVDSVWRLLKILVLRRKKQDVELSIPPKRELRLLCPLSEMQNFWYKRILVMSARYLNGGDNISTSARMALANLMMQLRKVSNHPFLFPHIEDMNDDGNSLKDMLEASGKLSILDRLLSTLKSEGHRCCIFSQFTSMLDILEDYCVLRGIKYTRLDGSTNRVQRVINMRLFNMPDSQLDVFLASTRAGGQGINLQTADTCILFDSDWNPQCDVQAMGRVHRIGQTKPVTVYRLISTGTVEERIVARATRKLMLDEMVSGGSKAMLSAANPAGDEEEDVEKEPDALGANESDMKRALLFSMKKMFKKSGGVTTKIDADDDDATVLSPESLDKLIQAARSGLDAFVNEDEDEDEDSVIETKAGSSTNDEEDRCFALTADASNTRVFKGEDFTLDTLYSGRSLTDIRNEWEQRNYVKAGKREGVSRLISVDGGVGVGQVQVLKTNMYTLESGEPSILQKETSAKARGGKMLRAGVDYFNLTFCMVCGEDELHGDIVMCDGCPVTLHVKCLEYDSLAEFEADHAVARGVSKFYCTHHTCSG